ncbi:hypothetical protein [Caballeronia sp.]|uniref:hypothetical protein n=1 Tax=Caballeronia sp. TaxID=1931223 RepID=UPI003C394FA4
MFAGERRWNRGGSNCANCAASTELSVNQDNVAETHGLHQRLDIDTRIDACATRDFVSARPVSEHAGAMVMRRIERH